MKKDFIFRLAIQSLWFTSLFTTNNLWGQCDAILSQGIYDYENTSSFRDRSSSFINWYKNRNIQTFQEAKNASGNATLPIEGILVGMGFSYNESGFKQFQNFVENYTQQTETEKSKFDQVMKTINPNIISAWKDCMNRYGLHVWIEHTENEYEFVLCANYISDGVAGTAYLESIGFGGGSVTTSESILYNNGTTTKKQLSGKITRQIFIRQNKKPFTIVVNANRGSGLKYSFSEIVPKKVLKTITLVLKENENCTTDECLDMKNIQNVKILSFKSGRRVSVKGLEYSYFESSDPTYLSRLKFGDWTNPQCERIGLKEGKYQGRGWHLYGASRCTCVGQGDGIADVIEVRVKVTYLE